MKLQDRLFILAQHLLPHHLLSRVIGGFADDSPFTSDIAFTRPYTTMERPDGSTAKVAMGARAAARVEFAYRPQKPGNAFRDAERRRARYAAVIGSDEAERGVLKLKHLGTGAQQDVALADLNTFLEQENA